MMPNDWVFFKQEEWMLPVQLIRAHRTLKLLLLLLMHFNNHLEINDNKALNKCEKSCLYD